ncbi:esterase YqiA [Moritella sp.]|uniref:esterase YqiA n=1 Tax=Moritella sp. TaxID=78556 RepID=UPI001DEDF46B|nr:esterase YqiA [Moritella sp.]MCJ8349625.1 esterase YqiA [Moritella sp.]NQZ41178.1 esterase YqiA [Moritella sp.]
MAPMLLLYLHGFNSSPKSIKAQQMADYLGLYHPEITIEIPNLSPYPQQAWLQIEAIVARYPGYQLGVVGSSLGGYYATKVNQVFNRPAVIVNPAVKPYELLVDYLGENTNQYTDNVFILTEQHIDELRALDCPVLVHPETIWALLQTDDEVLDYSQATAKYNAAKLTVEQGGDHAFIGFERYLSDILTFLAFK